MFYYAIHNILASPVAPRLQRAAKYCQGCDASFTLTKAGCSVTDPWLVQYILNRHDCTCRNCLLLPYQLVTVRLYRVYLITGNIVFASDFNFIHNFNCVTLSVIHLNFLSEKIRLKSTNLMVVFV